MAEVLTLSSTVVLGKRRRSDSLYLHSASSSSSSFANSHSESEYELPLQLSGSSVFSEAESKDAAGETKRQYRCNFAGCTKTYTRPSRLAEHQRSHTGDRPYVCATCNKSYLRETHLQAHARSHLPESARPHTCDEPGCNKRFWTTQHLRVHSELHKGEKPFKCMEPSCDAAFPKHHQLRDHFCFAHCPPGTKSYICQHHGCTKSFTTNQKLRAHTKTHDEKRYTCVHDACRAAPGMAPTYYATWTALQHHMRTAHPPTCPYASCKGKTFTAQKGLRAHLKLHVERDVDAQLENLAADSNDENDEERPKKRRRGGEVGRDWLCEVSGCGKDFKSKKALTTHHKVNHLGRRDFVCPHEDCRRAFGYKHLLQRHMAKLHRPRILSGSDGEDDCASDEDAGTEEQASATAEQTFNIDFITGVSYKTRSQEQIKTAGKLMCPYPDLPPTFLSAKEPCYPSAGPSSRRGACEYVFSRAYDLRRHLRAEHTIDVAKDLVDAWVKEAKRSVRRALD
ncbi:hypothetical protein OBBRIDRAFT_765331 [Obba rivulosa]|uniref:C2H2-type domain-containing protein n=1 Tax=Obba rivulosa TaxID=1052685 RepID=A0A8E2DVN6_9APHY|nr:hypothetical protein OBBRIDRAFT_765331 [Obba rivulosa]